MTTIAYKDGVLAADTSFCRGGSMMAGVQKVVRRDDGAMAAIVGMASLQGPFFAWFLGGEKGERPTVPDTDDVCATALIVRPDGVTEVYEAGGFYRIAEGYWSFGSGRDVALGAMFAGAAPDKAVEAAILHDQGTGGAITVLRR